MSRLEIEFSPRSLGRRCGRERSSCSDSIKIMKTRSRHLKRLLLLLQWKKRQPTWGERSSKNQPRRSHRECVDVRAGWLHFSFAPECSKAKVLGGWRPPLLGHTAVVLCGHLRETDQMSRSLGPGWIDLGVARTRCIALAHRRASYQGRIKHAHLHYFVSGQE